MKKLRTSLAALAVLVASTGLAGAQEFRWQGAVQPGGAIEIKGVNGDIRAEASSTGQVEVTASKSARRSNPESVKIEVLEHAGGVTICAVYPSRDGSRPNECMAGSGGRMNVQDNDVQVRFTVRVPAGVRMIGRTVNGDIAASGLDAAVQLSTVNGSVNFGTAGSGSATTVNGSIKGSLGRADWTGALEFSTVKGTIALTLPPDVSTDVKASTVNGDIESDFPLTITGRFSRRHLDGTIGSGGRSLSLETVNGAITLKRP